MVLGKNYKMYTECKLFLIFSFDRKGKEYICLVKGYIPRT